MNNESDDFIDDSKYALGAWIREDYKTAYKVLLPLAEQEDAGARRYTALELPRLDLVCSTATMETEKIIELAGEEFSNSRFYKLSKKN